MALTKATLAVILLAAMTSGTVAIRDIPEFLHICNTQDPNFIECVMKSIEFLRQYLKSGVPEYNIPTLEPLRLDRLIFAPSSTIRIQTRDLDVYGPSNFRVTGLKVDLNTLNFVVDIAIPNLFVKGQYELDGKVLLLPLRGSGAIHGNFTDCSGVARIKGEKYLNKHGVEKIRINDFRLKIVVDSGTLRLDNLFNGDHVIGEVINTTINNNFHMFVKEVLPLLEKGLSDSLRKIANHIVEQFSYAQLFPN